MHHNRFLILLLVCFLQFFAAGPIYGQEPAPGDACSVDQRYTRVGGPETSGVSHLMVCESGTWKAVLSTDATGKITEIGNQTCTSGQVLEFDGTSWVCAPSGSVVSNEGDCDEGEAPVWNAGASEFRCPVDSTPDAYSFNDQTNVVLSTAISSNIIQITGINDDINISISGDGSPEYRVCADSGCSTVNHNWSSVSGNIDNNEYLQARLTSSPFSNTMRSATINVGTGSDQWDVTTQTVNQNFVFITSATYDGNLGGISGADSKCQTLADNAGLGGTYLAWIAADGTTPNSRFTKASNPYILTDGAQIASDYNDLTDLFSNLDNPINRDENGALVSSARAWTYVDEEGNQAYTNGMDCDSWTTNSGWDGKYGRSDRINDDWTDSGSDEEWCGNAIHLYCFEQ